MKLIKPNVQIIPQEDLYKHIELCGRTCYMSQDKITEDSAKGFIERMIQSGHGAMLEHGTLYFNIPVKVDEAGNFLDEVSTWTKCKLVESEKGNWWAITTNLRVMVEHFAPEYIENLIEKYLCEPTEYHEKRITVKFVTDQGILREFTRHRMFSFAVESTRYCNYSKDKFDNEVTYILPPWIDENLINSQFKCCTSDSWGDLIYEYFKCSNELDIRNFLFSLSVSEQIYLSLIKQGWTAQLARNVLPLATKCDIIMTGFVSDWKHFFELRALGTTGAPHPQAKELVEPLRQEFIKRNWI